MVTSEPSACQAVAISTADDAAADDGQPARHLLRGGRLPAGPRPRRGEPGEVGQHGAAARADGDGVPGGQRRVPPSGSVTTTRGARRAGRGRARGRRRRIQPAGLAVVLPVRGEAVAAGEHRRGVQPAGHGLRGARDTARASASAATGRSRALLGMQAQYEHSPPTSSFSTITVLSPAACARSATFSPTGPAPITMTS